MPAEKLARTHALVVGVGAVGRQVALQLASMGVGRLTVYDFDFVEPANVAAQMYSPRDLERPKVLATGADCRRLNPELDLREVGQRFAKAHADEFEADETAPVVFCCVDTITARRDVWNWTRRFTPLFLDARVAGEAVRVVADDAPGRARYGETLFTQAEAHRGSCTAKMTVYCAAIAAGLMLAQFAKWLRGRAVNFDHTLALGSLELDVKD